MPGPRIIELDAFSTTCDLAPKMGCRQATKSLLLLKDDSEDDSQDKLIWKWKGQATNQTEFADPVNATGYALCIYAGPHPLPFSKG